MARSSVSDSFLARPNGCQSAWKGKKMLDILIVDDDVCLGLILSEYLEAAGYCCTLAENVAQARKHLLRKAFDLVVSDVNMPGESGFDLLDHVTSHYVETAFLLMSAMDDTSNKQRALQMGACGYLVKPFRLSELHARIGIIVQHYSRTRNGACNGLSARIEETFGRSMLSIAQNA